MKIEYDNTEIEQFWKEIDIIAYGMCGKWFWCISGSEGDYTLFDIDSTPKTMSEKCVMHFIYENHLDGESICEYSLHDIMLELEQRFAEWKSK